MTTKEYLEAILRDQTLASTSQELKDLRERRKEVEAHLRSAFPDSKLTIRYGGSMAKGTMNKSSYDLDLPCYVAHDDDSVGETLAEIYENVRNALQKSYSTDPKTSAIRLRAPADLSDFHVDVVPGRFVEGSDGDIFIYQASAEKCRLKTNLDTHIACIRDSGVVDTIRLLKYWRDRLGMSMKTFVLELLAVELLKGKKNSSLSNQLIHIFTAFRDSADDLSVQDPANPEGNDLSGYLDRVRVNLETAARSALDRIEADDWESVFGPVTEESRDERIASLGRVAASVSSAKKPWCP